MAPRARRTPPNAVGRGGSACPPSALLAGLLLAATYGVSGGDEIRRSDAPRLVDLVRERPAVRSIGSPPSVTRWPTQIDNHHGGSPGTDAALAAITRRADALAATAGLTPCAGPGLVVTLNDAQRDANGRFPRDASPDDLVVHQQDIQAVLNALWSAGAEGIQMQDQRIIATSAPRCVGNTLLLNGRTYSPPYVITAIGDVDGDAGGPRCRSAGDALQAVRDRGSGSATPRRRATSSSSATPNRCGWIRAADRAAGLLTLGVERVDLRR